MSAFDLIVISLNLIAAFGLAAYCIRRDRGLAKSVSLAVQALEKNEKLIDHCIDINRLENEADRLLRSTIADLFNKEKDCIVLIKLKEVYELLEATTDRCEDVADVLQNVVVKNS